MTAEQYIESAVSAHGAAQEVARNIAGIIYPEFSSEPMTVKDASDLTGLTQSAIRAGILNGWLPIGKQISGTAGDRANFIIFPRKVWELTGHVWRGREKLKCSENP